MTLVVLEAAISSPEPDLDATVAVQAAVIAELRAANASLVAANATLQARVAELERRLGRDSANSSRPPSQDGLRKPARAVRRAAERGEGRRPGKQPGAPGAQLTQVATPDEVVWHAPDRCGGCGAELAGAAVVGVQARQVFDLPPLHLAVVEHRVQRRRCACGSTTAAAFPAHARAAACYGPGVRALVPICACTSTCPSSGPRSCWATCWVRRWPPARWPRCWPRARPGWRGSSRSSATGWRPRRWRTSTRPAPGWPGGCTGSTRPPPRGLSLFTVHAKRGKVAMDAAGVLPDFAGVAVHDGWSPYWRYPVTHALCGAHLLRELEGIAEGPGQGWAAGMGELPCDVKLAGDRARAAGLQRVDDRARARLQGRYQRLLADGQAANPPPARGRRRGRARRSPAARLLVRLDAHRDEVLRSLDDTRVPFDNNQGERDLRMVKLQQKISGCWRTPAGAQAFLTLRSYVSTARKQGMNPLAVLRQLFEGHPWLPAPVGS